MNSLLVIIISLSILTFYIIAMFQFAELVVDKGYPEKEKMVMALCFFVPIAGYLYVCALPNRTREINVESLVEKLTKELAVQTTVSRKKTEDSEDYIDQLPEI